MAGATTTLGLCVMLSMMHWICFANPMEIKEHLDKVKEQVRLTEEFIKARQTEFETERKSVFEIVRGNNARLKCLKMHSNLSPPEMEKIESYTENTNARVRRSFTEMAEVLEDHKFQLEQLKAQIKYFEASQDGFNTFAM